MADEIRTHLETIKIASTKLNESADRLARAVRTLNEQLSRLNVGIVTYYTDEYYESSTDYESGESASCRYYLGYDRDKNGTWGISVMCRWSMVTQDFGSDKPAGDDRKSRIRWVKAFDACPRNVRLSLAIYIPKVIAGLAQATKHIADDIDVSLSSIEAIDLTN